VAEVVALARRSVDKRIKLEQCFDAQHAITVGDASALQNALLNLLLNARDAMPSGGTLRFATRNVDVALATSRDSESGLAPGKYIAIEVSDSGSGIEPGILGKIFEPFFTTKSSGTGMGLAAVQGTVLEHQGTLDVSSELGRGSTFRLLLPVGGQLQPVEASASTRPSVLENSARVLVVDDEATVASVIKQALEDVGYDVNCCSGGQQALEYCRRQQFDLVLLDVMMPDLDGVEVLHRLKASGAHARVIMMTGHAPESIQARLREYPNVAVLPKPFLPQELIQEVRETLAQARVN